MKEVVKLMTPLSQLVVPGAPFHFGSKCPVCGGSSDGRIELSRSLGVTWITEQLGATQMHKATWREASIETQWPTIPYCADHLRRSRSVRKVRDGLEIGAANKLKLPGVAIDVAMEYAPKLKETPRLFMEGPFLGVTVRVQSSECASSLREANPGMAAITERVERFLEAARALHKSVGQAKGAPEEGVVAEIREWVGEDFKEVVEAARQLLWRHGSKHLTAEEKYYWTLKEPPPR